MKTLAAIALGSNLGDRAAQLSEAAARLSDHGDVVRVSRLYETAPMYLTEQPAFLNAALVLRTTLDPVGVLRVLLATEERLGRLRSIRFGPRTIDLDLISHGDNTMVTPELELPHPRLGERPFVLYPLLDVMPEWTHPTTGSTLRELASQFDSPPIVTDPRWRHALASPFPRHTPT